VKVSTEVRSELSELVAAPSQTVCFLARTYNDAIESHYRSDAQPRLVPGCPQPPTPPLHPRPRTAAARTVTAAAGKHSSGEVARRARGPSGESPFVETLVNLTLHSQLQNVEWLNVDEMLELAATILQTHCDSRCDHIHAHLG